MDVICWLIVLLFKLWLLAAALCIGLYIVAAPFWALGKLRGHARLAPPPRLPHNPSNLAPWSQVSGSLRMPYNLASIGRRPNPGGYAQWP